MQQTIGPKDPSVCVSFVRSPSPRRAHAVRSSGEDTDIEEVRGRVEVEVQSGTVVDEWMDDALGKSDPPPRSLESGKIGDGAAKIWTRHIRDPIGAYMRSRAWRWFPVTYSTLTNSNLTSPVFTGGHGPARPSEFH